MTNPQVPPAGPPFGGDRVSPILGVASPRKSAEYWRDVFGFSLDPVVYVYVDDLTTVFRDLVARGATLVQPPTAMPYGLVELLTEDSDGHRVAFGQFIP